eukprot:3130675-Rhodomonas_salina.2
MGQRLTPGGCLRLLGPHCNISFQRSLLPFYRFNLPSLSVMTSNLSLHISCQHGGQRTPESSLRPGHWQTAQGANGRAKQAKHADSWQTDTQARRLRSRLSARSLTHHALLSAELLHFPACPVHPPFSANPPSPVPLRAASQNLHGVAPSSLSIAPSPSPSLSLCRT